MILSQQQIFSDGQLINVDDSISENVIDLGVRGTPYDGAAPLIGDVGKGIPVPILVQVVETFDRLDDLTITLETSDNEDLTTSTELALEVILDVELIAGKQMFMQYLPNGVTGRYLGVRYTVRGSTPVVGRITAGISMGNQTNQYGA